MKRPLRRRTILLVLGVALVLRLAYVLLTPDYQIYTDSAEYDRIARSFASGSGYPESILVPSGGPSAFTPPVYSLFLTPTYIVTGDSLPAARVTQALIGVAVILILGLVTTRVFGSQEATIVMWVATLSPMAIVEDGALLSEALATAFTLASILSILKAKEKERTLFVVAGGALAGLAILTRSTAVVVLLPLAFGAAQAIPRHRVRAVATLAASVALVNAPWVVRNAIETDSFVPLSTRSGEGLIRTYNDTSRLGDPPSLPRDDEPAAAVYRTPGISEVQADREYRRLGMSYMREHPTYVVLTLARNTLRALQLDDIRLLQQSIDASAPNWLLWAGIFAFYPIGFFAIVGVVSLRRGLLTWIWAIPPLLFFSVIHFSDGRLRYRWPVDPFIEMVAAAGVAAAWRWWHARNTAQADAQSAS